MFEEIKKQMQTGREEALYQYVTMYDFSDRLTAVDKVGILTLMGLLVASIIGVYV